MSFLAILFIPPIPAKSEMHCHNGVTLMKFCPPNLDSIDNCTINRVMNETNDDKFGSQIKCSKNDAWKGICDYWNVPGLCESTEKKFQINTKVAHNRILFEENCFDVTFVNGSINGHDSTLYCPGAHKISLDCDVRFDDETANEVFAGATDAQAKSTYQFWSFFMMLVISWAGMAVSK